MLVPNTFSLHLPVAFLFLFLLLIIQVTCAQTEARVNQQHQLAVLYIEWAVFFHPPPGQALINIVPTVNFFWLMTF
jgi:hypothetical protein